MRFGSANMGVRLALLISLAAPMGCEGILCADFGHARPMPSGSGGAGGVATTGGTAGEGGSATGGTDCSDMVEDPWTATDDDCDGLLGNHRWSLRIGSGSTDPAPHLAVDSADDIIVAGPLIGTLPVGNEVHASVGKSDVLVGKLDNAGNVMWSRRFGDVESDYPADVALDAQDNIVIAGQVGAATDFGGGPVTYGGTVDAFVLKLDRDGGHLWSMAFGDALEQRAYAVATRSDGRIAVTGMFSGTISLPGAAPLTTIFGETDVFVAMFDDEGTHLCSRMSGGQGEQIGRGLAFDAEGDLLVTGSFENNLSFGGHALTGEATVATTFVVKLDAACQPVWSKALGPTTHHHANHNVAVDGDGSVVVAATLVDQVELDDGLRSSAGGQDILVVKLDTDGVLLWSRSWGSSQDDRGYDASVDATGHILITGRHAGPLDLGNGLHPSQGGPFDAFLMKLRPNGDLAWAWFFGSPGDEAIGGTAIDSAGNVIFSAAFHETVDFGGGALTSAGDYDVVIAQYAP